MYNKSMFISQNIIDMNNLLMDMYFTFNKKMDNFMDYVDINLVMNNLSGALHKIAHMYPLDADRFRDYNAMYSFRSIYGTIEGQYKNFDNILTGLSEVLEYILDIDNSLTQAKKIGKEEDNPDYCKFISDEVKQLRKYKKQFIFMYDKIQACLTVGNTLQDIDFNYKDFLTLDVG